MVWITNLMSCNLFLWLAKWIVRPFSCSSHRSFPYQPFVASLLFSFPLHRSLVPYRHALIIAACPVLLLSYPLFHPSSFFALSHWHSLAILFLSYLEGENEWGKYAPPIASLPRIPIPSLNLFLYMVGAMEIYFGRLSLWRSAVFWPKYHSSP